jgi:hypothetical protein
MLILKMDSLYRIILNLPKVDSPTKPFGVFLKVIRLPRLLLVTDWKEWVIDRQAG